MHLLDGLWFKLFEIPDIESKAVGFPNVDPRLEATIAVLAKTTHLLQIKLFSLEMENTFCPSSA